MPRVVCDLRIGDAIAVGLTRVRMAHKSGQVARLVVEAPADIAITLERAARNQVVSTDEIDRLLPKTLTDHISDV